MGVFYEYYFRRLTGADKPNRFSSGGRGLPRGRAASGPLAAEHLPPAGGGRGAGAGHRGPCPKTRLPAAVSGRRAGSMTFKLPLVLPPGRSAPL